MPSPTLTGWNGGYILFAQFLTFEQESIKAKNLIIIVSDKT